MAGRSNERTMVVVGSFPGEDGGSLRSWAAAHVTAFTVALPGAAKEPTAAKSAAEPPAQPAEAKGKGRKVASCLPL
jgi:hypothetical protein